ncbi:MAG: hypothetical protein GY865_14070 [candidate division Zixibacteria bacterium]|nr:hypothetical protein [candidate division Zixibacteria bacterium]
MATAYAEEIWPTVPKPGTVAIITEQDRSLDNGATWYLTKSIRVASSEDEIFDGAHHENGPSIGGGFWGNCNEIRSGHTCSYCSRFDGKRWRSMK